MKLKDVKTYKTEKPAFKVDEFSIVFETHDNRITGLKVTIRGKTKKIKVMNDNIKAAFIKAEKYFKMKF